MNSKIPNLVDTTLKYYATAVVKEVGLGKGEE